MKKTRESRDINKMLVSIGINLKKRLDLEAKQTIDVAFLNHSIMDLHEKS